MITINRHHLDRFLVAARYHNIVASVDHHEGLRTVLWVSHKPTAEKILRALGYN